MNSDMSSKIKIQREPFTTSFECTLKLENRVLKLEFEKCESVPPLQKCNVTCYTLETQKPTTYVTNILHTICGSYLQVSRRYELTGGVSVLNSLQMLYHIQHKHEHGDRGCANVCALLNCHGTF